MSSTGPGFRPRTGKIKELKKVPRRVGRVISLELLSKRKRGGKKGGRQDKGQD